MNKKIKTDYNFSFLIFFVFSFLIFFVFSASGQAQNTPKPPSFTPSEDDFLGDELLTDSNKCCEIVNITNNETVGCYAVGTKQGCDNKATQGLTLSSFKPNETCFDSFYNKVNDRDSLGSYCLNEKNESKNQLPVNSGGIFSKECLTGNSLSGCLKNSFFPNSGLPGPRSTNLTVTKNLILTYVGLIINLILGFLGIIFLIIIIYAGIQWLIAADDENKIKEQKDRLRNAVIGIAITLMAYGLSFFILSVLTSAS